MEYAFRAKQLCGLKFRREHSVAEYFVDFACVERMLIVEIDGGYHDHTATKDFRKETVLNEKGWDVIRFSDEEVMDDVEAVARAIAKHLDIEFSFRRRSPKGSGMKSRFDRRDGS